jgi:hypothetical protein
MKHPDFFNQIETITLYDDLTKFLGVNDDGLLEFSYADIVKSAGHSCATVAGAYLVALKGLSALYEDGYPQRGEIKVELRRATTDDNAGVVGCVLSNITGATTDYGFGGIPTGKYNRRGTLLYEVEMDADVALTRLDTNQTVYVSYKPQSVVNPMAILKSAIMPDAKEEDIASFPQRFQEMVATVFANADKVIEVTKA